MNPEIKWGDFVKTSDGKLGLVTGGPVDKREVYLGSGETAEYLSADLEIVD